MKGNIWIGTSNGLNRFDPIEETLLTTTTTVNPHSLNNNQVRSLHLPPR